MAYIALYRAYRPQRFSEVVGQQHIVKTLQNALKLNKVAHAYLFSGPRGTGKTTMAKILAKALNCDHLDANYEPCNECDICKGITKGMVTDVVEIDAASNNGADDIRELRDGVKFSPSVGKCKVYIIDEVHMLSNAAFNALLKTLEEPPKNVVFVLATTEPYKLPNTILSRCQRFDFQSLSSQDIIKRLKIIIEAESLKVSEDAIAAVAEYSEGGMRDAISLLDQAISYSTTGEITADDILAISGNTSSTLIFEIAKACYMHQDAIAIKNLNSLLELGKEVPRIINDTMMFLRDVLMYKNQIILENKIIFNNKDYIEFTKKITTTQVYSWLDILNTAQNNMRFSNQKKAYFELALLKMSDTKVNDSVILLDKVNKLESDVLYLQNKLNDLKSIPENKVYEIDSKPINVSTISEPKPVLVENKPVEPVVSTKVIEDVPAPSYEAPIVSDEGNVTVKEIEEILNNPNLAKKNQLKQLWGKLEFKYPNLFILQIIIKGEIVATSNDKFIVVLMDEGFCNRVMKYENNVKIMEIINQNGHLFDDYICIPVSIWLSIKADFANQYKNGITKPILNDIKIPVKKKVIPNNNETDPFLDKVYDLFDESIVKVED